MHHPARKSWIVHMAKGSTLRKKRRFFKKKLFIIGILAGLLALASYVAYLDFTVRDRFEGKRFALPARVYARPLELYPGLKLRVADLLAEMNLLGYRDMIRPRTPGTYHCSGRSVELVTRPFAFGSGRQESMALRVVFDGTEVQTLQQQTDNATEHFA